MKFLKKLFGGTEEKVEPVATETTPDSSSNVKTSSSSNEDIKDLESFVDYIVKALVDEPNNVSIYVEEEPDATVIKVECNKDDIGKVIGKKGRTIMAIRSLVSGAGGRLQKRVKVEVCD